MPAATTNTRASSSRLPLRAYLSVALLIFAAATGPVAIRQTQQVGVPSLAIISMRLLLSSLLMAPWILRRHGQALRLIKGRQWPMVTMAGTFLALNLILLFYSLEYTSVLVSSVLRRTAPLWVMSLEILLLGVVFRRHVWWALLLTLIGSGMVALGSGGAIEPGSQPLLGAILALIGSVSNGLYILSGRAFRHQLPSLLYIWLIFAVAAVLTTLLAWLSGIPFTGYSVEGYAWVLVVTFITQFLGHVPLNISLRYFHATHTSIATQAAVVFSAIMAFFFFNEIPSAWQIIGSLLILGGVAWISLQQPAK